eukprot:scaffold6661_cov122-Skeletonema_marinoi.AAC.3
MYNYRGKQNTQSTALILLANEHVRSALESSSYCSSTVGARCTSSKQVEAAHVITNSYVGGYVF